MNIFKSPSVHLPKTDELIERHQFYATITCLINDNTSDLFGIGEKIGKFICSFEKLRDDVNASTIRNKTIIGTVIVAWSVVGGGIGIYIQKTVATAEQVLVRIDSLERKVAALEAQGETKKDIPDKLAAVSRKLIEAERRIDDLETGKKK